MKKFLLLSLLSVLFITAFSDDAYAQRRGTKKKKSSRTDEYFDESGFVNKLWFGGGIILGFSGSNNESLFTFGLSPMVGYKVLDDLISIGPRVGFEYNHYRLDLGQVYKNSSLSYSVGAFSRIKAFPNFFAHLEYEYQNTEFIDGFDNVQGKLTTSRVTYDNVYVGAGYNSGGLLGYEIMLLYNVNQPENTVASPFDIRAGFTYKF